MKESIGPDEREGFPEGKRYFHITKHSQLCKRVVTLCESQGNKFLKNKDISREEKKLGGELQSWEGCVTPWHEPGVGAH